LLYNLHHQRSIDWRVEHISLITNTTHQLLQIDNVQTFDVIYLAKGWGTDVLHLGKFR